MDDRSGPTHSSYLEAERLTRRAYNDPIRVLLTHWLTLHDRQGLPDRCGFDPETLPDRVRPHVFALELGGNARWRAVLVGSHVTAALGRDFTGHELIEEQIPGISRSRTLRLLDRVAVSGLPEHFHGRSSFRFQDGYADHEQVLLPFRCTGGDRVDFVVGGIFYEGLNTREPAARAP